MKLFIKGTLLIVFFAQLGSNKMPSQDSAFTFRIIMPEPSSDLNKVQIQQLESRITQIVNNSNEVVIGQTNDLVIYPQISIEGSVEEGSLTLELSLFVKQLNTNVVFNSISQKIKGNGDNKTAAISNAISQINIADESYKQFILTAKTKALKYYAGN